MIIALIPAYNEEISIGEVVQVTSKYVDKVIVCDDGSIDNTAHIAEKNGALVVKHKHNQGKGAALNTLFNYARQLKGDVFVTLDADGQHDPIEIPSLVQPILDKEADVVVGSRFLLAPQEMPFYRRIGNKILNIFVNISKGQYISDTQCGYRAYSDEAIKLIRITTKKIGEVDSEIVLSIKENGFRISEIPISCKYNGIRKSTYNPLKYVIDVILFIIRKLFFKRPLIFFGLTGTILLLLGGVIMIYTLEIYFITKSFSIGIMLFSMISIIVGMISISTGIILYAVQNLINQTRQVKDIVNDVD